MKSTSEIRAMLWDAIDGYATAKATSHPGEDAWRRVIGEGMALLEAATRQDAEHAAVMAMTSKAGGHA